MKSRTTENLIVTATAVAALLIATFVGLPATAQSSQSEATSGSSAEVNVDQVAGASSNITFNSPSEVSTTSTESVNITSNGTLVTSGEQTLRTVGTQTAPSMSSGHPCLLPTSVGIGIIGAGASFGTGQVDDACMLAQMGMADVALVMIAARNGGACRALRDTGRINIASRCAGDAAPAAAETVSTQNMAQSDNTASITCERDARGNLVRIAVHPGVTVEEARAFCR